MKNLLTYTLIILVLFLFSFTKSGYETAMENTINDMHKAKNVEQITEVANTFERIGAAEKNKWLPSYYVAYCYTMMATVQEDVTKWDDYLDIADGVLEKTTKFKKADKVEILVLQGFLNMLRISVDPATRGQEYSMKSAVFLQQAHQLDDQNPRVNLMMAQMLYGTANFFGSSTFEACNKFKQAKLSFEQEAKKDSGISPSWGKKQAEAMLLKCTNTNQDN